MPSIVSPSSSVTSTVFTGPPWNLISLKPLPGPGTLVSTPVGLALIEPVIVKHSSPQLGSGGPHVPVYFHVFLSGGRLGGEASVCMVKCAFTSFSGVLDLCVTVTVSSPPRVLCGYHGDQI